MLSAGFIASEGSRRRRRIDGMALCSGRWAASAYNQPFRVASISKMITALGFMPLLARGRIGLDDDISIHLGESLRHPEFPGHPITVRMLLTHTSGLRNGDDFPVPFNRPLLRHLSEAAAQENYRGWFGPASEPPGVWFRYSDTNFALVAQIIERVTGVRFDRYMHETLFAPMNLEIGYNWSGVSQRKRRRAAAACRWIGGAWRAEVDAEPPLAPALALYRGENNESATEADYAIGENGFAFAPHGGLRLTLADMDRLARFFLQGAPIDGASAVALMSAGPWRYNAAAPNGATENGFYQAYGLGLQMPLGTGDAFFGAATPGWRGHCGDAYGWMTGLWWNERTQSTLVYAINGMPENERPHGNRSAMTAPEEAVIDAALAQR
ncbi:MAG: serine hydrolase [Hyphomonadaceae bacterium]